MNPRLSRAARRQIARVLLDSAARFGEDAAARYNDLILAAIAAVGRSPETPAAGSVPGQASVRTSHLRLARRLTPASRRVARPRHLILYRSRPGDAVVILGLVHERMLVERAAAELARRADEG